MFYYYFRKIWCIRMNDVSRMIQEQMSQFNYEWRMVSIEHLPEVQESVGKLIKQGLIDKSLYDTWHFYVDTNKNLPEAKSVVIVAMPQKIKLVTFNWQGTAYPAYLPPGHFTGVDESRVKEILNNALGTAGHKVVNAHLAMKTLAVRSGLAKYGRNNLAYVPGMGSFCRLIAFYTDSPCYEDNWQETGAMKTCESCSLCRENCPVHSISTDRFLIHAEYCRTYREAVKDFVAAQPDQCNTLIGCMRCQQVCPVNKPYITDFASGPIFSDEETDLILNKTPAEKLSLDIRQKLERLVDKEIYPLLARNLKILIEKQPKVVQ